MKNTVKIAFCGVMAALCTALLFLTGVVPVATIAIPALAGCLLIPVVAEMGTPWGFGTYAVVAVLAFLLTPDREAALFYVLFFGYYPTAYAPLSRIGGKALRYAVKFLLFNAAVVLETALAVFVLGIPLESIGFLGRFTAPVLWALANLVFFLYDHAMDGLIALYIRRFHGRVSRALQGK